MIIDLDELHQNKLNWNDYFLLLAELISTRSKDPSTHHGCILTDENYRIISCGYNGSVQGINDDLVPKTRPDKYFYTLHAEENAILFAKRDLTHCKAFITGRPCSRCTRMLIQSGIREIIYGNRSSQMIDELDTKVTNFLCEQTNTKLVHINNY